MLTKEAILHVLEGVEDPELKKPLTELDMVKFIEIDDGNITIGITLTIPGCPLKEKITNDITESLEFVPGVESVKIVFDSMTDEQRQKLFKKLRGSANVGGKNPVTIHQFSKRFIAISSGKGGVGKSTVTTNLACALAAQGHNVGVLDADVYGFSIPRMIGVSGQPTLLENKIIPLRKGDNIQVVSMGFFVDEDEPVIWRGPMLHKAINQFLADVLWDSLDFLLLDLPPGTGDVTLTIAQAIPSAELLIVTTPQKTATHVAGRVAKLAEKTNLKVIGVIENMSYYESNGKKEFIFGKDGGKELAAKLETPFLGEIPLLQSIREGSDNGQPVAISGPPEIKTLFENLANKIKEMAT